MDDRRVALARGRDTRRDVAGSVPAKGKEQTQTPKQGPEAAPAPGRIKGLGIAMGMTFDDPPTVPPAPARTDASLVGDHSQENASSAGAEEHSGVAWLPPGMGLGPLRRDGAAAPAGSAIEGTAVSATTDVIGMSRYPEHSQTLALGLNRLSVSGPRPSAGAGAGADAGMVRSSGPGPGPGPGSGSGSDGLPLTSSSMSSLPMPMPMPMPSSGLDARSSLAVVEQAAQVRGTRGLRLDRDGGGAWQGTKRGGGARGAGGGGKGKHGRLGRGSSQRAHRIAVQREEARRRRQTEESIVRAYAGLGAPRQGTRGFA